MRCDVRTELTLTAGPLQTHSPPSAGRRARAARRRRWRGVLWAWSGGWWRSERSPSPPAPLQERRPRLQGPGTDSEEENQQNALHPEKTSFLVTRGSFQQGGGLPLGGPKQAPQRVSTRPSTRGHAHQRRRNPSQAKLRVERRSSGHQGAHRGGGRLGRAAPLKAHRRHGGRGRVVSSIVLQGQDTREQDVEDEAAAVASGVKRRCNNSAKVKSEFTLKKVNEKLLQEDKNRLIWTTDSR